MFDLDRYIGFSGRDRFLTQLAAWSRRLTEDQRRTLPSFLVISPARTGSTWLAQALGRHPQVFVPGLKELKYFSSNWAMLDLGWYARQFAGQEDKVRGEASPSYAILPEHRIHCIRELMPDVKLVLFLREPVARIWSHTKQHYRVTRGPDALKTELAEGEILEYILSDGPALANDYEGCLRRWLSAFGAEQIFVGFLEDVAADPEGVLRRVLEFLGVDAPEDLSALEASEAVNVSESHDMPAAVRDVLGRLYGPRLGPLEELLRAQWGLELPDAWRRAHPAAPDGRPYPVFRTRGECDIYLAEGQFVAAPREISIEEMAPEALAEAQEQGRLQRGATLQEVVARTNTLYGKVERGLNAACDGEWYVPDAWLVEEHYFGFNIILFDNAFYALNVSMGILDVAETPAAELDRLIRDGVIAVGETLEEVRQQIAPGVVHANLLQEAEEKAQTALGGGDVLQWYGEGSEEVVELIQVIKEQGVHIDRLQQIVRDQRCALSLRLQALLAQRGRLQSLEALVEDPPPESEPEGEP